MPATIDEVLAALDARWDPTWAAEWDAVGLVTGDRDAAVDRVLFAVDATTETVEEALASGAQLLVAHHPLLLRGIHSVDTTTYKGRLLVRLIREELALVVAHTNADVAPDGVSDALAAALGLIDVEPLVPTAPGHAMKLVVFSPTDVTQRLVDVLSAAGAGAIGDYERCAFWVAGTGTFVPGAGSDPAVGRPGERTETHEDRLEMVLPPERLPAALQALRAVHPYEEPAYDVVPVLMPTQRAFGRVGTLREPVRLSDAAGWLARSLPASAAGVRVAGADRVVRRVAVCGGAGDDFIGDAARRGADLYVTADLRHHVTREAVEAGLALADVGHWSSEAPWLASAARLLRDDLAERGHELTCDASTLVTDPWSDHQPGGSRT